MQKEIKSDLFTADQETGITDIDSTENFIFFLPFLKTWKRSMPDILYQTPATW